MQERPSHSNTTWIAWLHVYVGPSIDRCDTRRVGHGARVADVCTRTHVWHS